MRLIIDFNQTLFDTDAFYDELPAPPQILREVYTPIDPYEEAFEGGEYSEDAQAVGEYSLQAVAEDLQEQGINVTADEIRAAFDHAPKFLYEPETLSYLDELKEEYGIDEVIVVSSSENPAWERFKIQASGVEDLVDEVIVLPPGLETATKVDFLEDIEDREDVFLIDDLPEEIERADVGGFVFDPEKHSLLDALRDMKHNRDMDNSSGQPADRI